MYPAIVSLWRATETAFKRVKTNGTTTKAGPATFATSKGGAGVALTLPSGRRILYREARIDKGRIKYRGVGPGGGPALVETYGARLVENAIQGIARDVMAEAMVRLERAGYPPVLTVHDEIVAEVAESDRGLTLDHFLRGMEIRPQWAPGLPLAASGWQGSRYRKD